MDDAGAGQNGTGYNLPNVERVELQTFIQLRRESVGLGPGGKLTKLLFDNGSGTTFGFTDYLSSVSPTWQQKVGKGTSVDWPVGLGGSGNPGRCLS